MGINPYDLVIDKTFKLGGRVDELKSKEYYSPDPKKLIGLLEDVIKQISRAVRKISQDDIVGIKRINLLLSLYHLCLDEIEHIEVNNVPVEMLPLFNRMKEKLRLKTVFVFRPSPLYNYSYYPITEFINEINKKEQHPEIKAKYDVAIISFPSSERNSALLHCSLAHEFAHHLNVEFSIAKEIEPKILEIIDEELLRRYVTKYRQSFSRTKTIVGKTEVTLDTFLLEERVRMMLTEECADIIRGWLDEIVSDIIALRLFGPAFVFAIAEFLISHQDVKKYSAKHPPPFIRLKCMMEIFDQLTFFNDLRSYPKIKERIGYYKKISEQTFESKDENALNLRNMILERGITKLFEPAKSLIESHLKTPKRPYKKNHVKHAVSAFINLIPANEVLNFKKRTSKPIDAISILNAAWIVRINFIDDLYSSLPNVEKAVVRNILDNLTLKSLDLQEFHRKMVHS